MSNLYFTLSKEDSPAIRVLYWRKLKAQEFKKLGIWAQVCLQSRYSICYGALRTVKDFTFIKHVSEPLSNVERLNRWVATNCILVEYKS